MQQKNSLIFAILISFSCYSQAPCVGGFAGEYPCNNYDLLSNIAWRVGSTQ